MSAAMKSMNLEKISTLMDKFEKEFEDLDVQTGVMEGAMSQTTATNVPQEPVHKYKYLVCCGRFLMIHLYIFTMYTDEVMMLINAQNDNAQGLSDK